MTRDTVIGNAMTEQLGKLRTRVDAARSRGQRSFVLDVDEAAFLLGLARILHEEVFSKPVGGEQAGRCASAPLSTGESPSILAGLAPAAGEETYVIGFGGRAGR